MRFHRGSQRTPQKLLYPPGSCTAEVRRSPQSLPLTQTQTCVFQLLLRKRRSISPVSLMITNEGHSAVFHLLGHFSHRIQKPGRNEDNRSLCCYRHGEQLNPWRSVLLRSRQPSELTADAWKSQVQEVRGENLDGSRPAGRSSRRLLLHVTAEVDEVTAWSWGLRWVSVLPGDLVLGVEGSEILAKKDLKPMSKYRNQIINVGRK